MKMRNTIHFLGMAALAILLCRPAPIIAGEPLPKGWQIDLQPAFKLLDAQLESAPQQGMNRISGAQVGIRDTELALTYYLLWCSLPPKEQDKLRAEQVKWLTNRTNRAAKAAAASEGGSIAPLEANLAALKFTEERNAELRKRLATSPREATPTRNLAPVPQSWRPECHFAIDWLEQDSEDGPITAIERNRGSQAAIRDAELVLVYLNLWSQCDETEREALKSEQTAWLAARKKTAAAAAEGQDDETLAALKVHHSISEQSVRRAAELRKRLSAKVSGKKPKR